jgi:hypothetical protein
LIRFWDWLTKGRYTRMLEIRVAVLEKENRAMLNALLTNAGCPTVDAPELKPPAPVQRLSRHQLQVERERQSARISP